MSKAGLASNQPSLEILAQMFLTIDLSDYVSGTVVLIDGSLPYNSVINPARGRSGRRRVPSR